MHAYLLLIVFEIWIHFPHFQIYNKKESSRKGKKKVIWYLLLFMFHQGSKAAKTAQDISAIYCENFVTERTAQKSVFSLQSEEIWLHQCLIFWLVGSDQLKSIECLPPWGSMSTRHDVLTILLSIILNNRNKAQHVWTTASSTQQHSSSCH